MWLASIVTCLALAAAGEPATPAVKLPEPIATRQNFFAIPFRVARADHPAHEPREVQLHWSGDRGATWQLYASHDPGQRQFLFRAGCDGEFWFAVRTVDQSGQVRPQKLVPEMRVIVDTIAPRVALTAKADATGQVQASWKIEDALLRADAVKLMYRVGSNGAWQRVPVDMKRVSVTGNVQSGEAAWSVAAGATDIQVRAEVVDAAGNPAVNHAQAKPFDKQTEMLASKPLDPSPAAATPTTAGGWKPAAGSEPGTQWPSEPYRVAGQSPANVAAEPAKPEPYRPALVNPAVATDANPPAEPIRWVDTRRIELEYDVNPLGGAVQRVEIWITVDGGRSWRLCAVDEDCRSPVLVTVDQDGVYGFRTMIQQANLAAIRPPQSGDRPELVIGVKTAR